MKLALDDPKSTIGRTVGAKRTAPLDRGRRVLLRVLANDVVPDGAVHRGQGLLFTGASPASSLGL